MDKRSIVIVDNRNSGRWKALNITPSFGKGDASYFSNSEAAKDLLFDWSNTLEDGRPRSIQDFDSGEFAACIRQCAEEIHLNKMSTRFVGTQEDVEEDLEEENPLSEHFIDSIMTDVDKGPWTDPNDKDVTVAAEEEIDREAELLEELPLPGNPKQERERKAKWLALPRRARIAIRRLHRNMRHLPKAA